MEGGPSEIFPPTCVRPLTSGQIEWARQRVRALRPCSDHRKGRGNTHSPLIFLRKANFRTSIGRPL